MDVKVFRTFLELAKVRHFGRAAENLYLTQAAVSVRALSNLKIISMLSCLPVTVTTSN